MSAIGIPVMVTYTVTASGQPAEVAPATPLQVAVAQVHLGLKGATGEMHPGIPLMVLQAQAAAEAAETSAGRVDLGALDQAVEDAEASAGAAENSRGLAVVAKEAAEAAAAAASGKIDRSGDIMAGHLEGPANASGNQYPRSSETVRNVGGAARMPSWTTAGRPATPGNGDTGLNTDLDCNETWHAAYSDWVQDGWQYGPVIPLAGLTAQTISGIPSWANEIFIHFNLVSSSTTTNTRLRIGHAGGLLAAGYQSATRYNNLVDGSAGQGLTTGIFFFAGATAVGLFGQVRLKRATADIWDVSSVLNDQTVGVVETSGWVNVTAPLTQLELALASGAFDAACSVNLSWRK